MILALLMGAGAGVGAFLAGLHIGRRLLWRQQRTNREFGHACLEELARVHGAKLEIVET